MASPSAHRPETNPFVKSSDHNTPNLSPSRKKTMTKQHQKKRNPQEELERKAVEGEIVSEKQVVESLEEAAEAQEELTEAQEAVDEAEAAAVEAAEAEGELSPEMAALIQELKEAREAADQARAKAEAAEKALADYEDKYLRAQAELQNFRRRKEREVAERIALANESLILELLPVLDDFERAFDAIPEEDREAHAAWVEGFELIYRKLQKILENQGLEAIDASGEFNPEVHEAVTMTPSDEVESGHIVAEFRKGYKLKDKVIRASLVSVAE